MRATTFTFAVLCLLLGQGFASVSFAADTGTIEGHVRRSRNKSGMADVRVQIRQTGANTTTAANGSYAFSGLAPGSYLLVFTADDLEPKTQQVTVKANAKAMVDIDFDESARAMEEIIVLGQRTPSAWRALPRRRPRISSTCCRSKRFESYPS